MVEQTLVIEKPTEAVKKPKYHIDYDFGKPDTIYCDTEKELHNNLLRLQKEAENNDNPYCDIFVYQGETDITDIVFFYFNGVDLCEHGYSQDVCRLCKEKER